LPGREMIGDIAVEVFQGTISFLLFDAHAGTEGWVKSPGRHSRSPAGAGPLPSLNWTPPMPSPHTP
jgi:hypothetical protein